MKEVNKMDEKISEINKKIENARLYLETFPDAIKYCKYDIERQYNNIEILNRTNSSDLKSMLPKIEQCEKIIKRHQRNLNEYLTEQQKTEQEIQDLLKELSEIQKIRA